MRSLAKSPIAPILGQRIPIRGPARLLYRSYAKSPCHLGDSRRRLTTKFGDEFDADLSSFLEWQLWAFGCYEEHFPDLFIYLLKPGDRCIDVGANIGIHTIRLAKLVGVEGEVIAIEPDAELATRARHNVRLNGLENVRMIQAAASRPGADSVLLYRPEEADANRGRASLLPHDYLTGPAAQVSAVCIDDLTNSRIQLMKIDVEGHEGAVISGAIHTIERYSPAIIFEHAPELLYNSSHSPFDWLKERCYELFKICQDRHSLTGNRRIRLENLATMPATGADILAISPPMVQRIEALVR